MTGVQTCALPISGWAACFLVFDHPHHLAHCDDGSTPVWRAPGSIVVILRFIGLEFYFYDQTGLQNLPNRHPNVWKKSILQGIMEVDPV